MRISTRIFLLAFICMCVLAFAQQSSQIEQSSDLFRQAEIRVRRLDYSELKNWNELIRTKLQEYYPWWYYYKTPRLYEWDSNVNVWDLQTNFLREEMIYSYFVADTANKLLDRNVLNTLKRIQEDRREPHRLRFSAASMLRVADELGVYPEDVCRKQKAKLSWEVVPPAADTQAMPQPVNGEVGTVLVVAVDEKSLCMIEGVDLILGIGDTIEQGPGKGVTIAGIQGRQVRFVKGGRGWTQKIGEAPAEQWK